MRFSFIEPMLLEASPSLPAGWLYEIKLDGYRALAGKVGGTVYLRSRNDNDFTTKYPTITKALQSLPDDTVVDGEVVGMKRQVAVVDRTREGLSHGPLRQDGMAIVERKIVDAQAVAFD